jgi:hypothetical protein
MSKSGRNSELIFAIRHVARYLIRPYVNAAMQRSVAVLWNSIKAAWIWVPLSMLLVFPVLHVRNTSLAVYFPGVARTRIASDYSDYPPAHLFRQVYFRDGALCAEYATISNKPTGSGSNPAKIEAVDPNDSTRRSLVTFPLCPLQLRWPVWPCPIGCAGKESGRINAKTQFSDSGHSCQPSSHCTSAQ